MRKPGQGAREKYRSLRLAWLRRTRRRFLTVIAVLAVVAALFNTLAVLYGRNWIWGAGVITGSFITAVMALRDSPPSYIARWEEGAWGEQATAKALRALEKRGWHVIHDLQTDYGNLDHVVIGRGGVFLLDSKWIVGEAKLLDDGYQVTRHEDPALTYQVPAGKGARAAARTLSDRIFETSRIRQWVQPVVVFTGNFDERQVERQRVTYLSSGELAEYLLEQPTRLSSEHAARIVQVVIDAYATPGLVGSR